jgi:capsular exopolysaccharide synthesis family protein
MSRLFEALQRSESERSGFDLAEPGTNAAELLQAAERSRIELEDFPEVPAVASKQSRLVCITEKESLAAEKFRFLAVRLRQIQQQRGLQKIIVTSTLPEEGKSLVSANLAITLARRKWQKVLLIDGDLRRPVIAERFGLSVLPGITEWVQGERTQLENIYRIKDSSLWIFPAGTPQENPLEVIQSRKLEAALEDVGHKFDWIIIDCPPALPLADTSVWMRTADGALLVIREGKSQKRQIRNGLEALDRSKLLGVVLNSSSNTEHQKYYQRYYRVHAASSDSEEE